MIKTSLSLTAIKQFLSFLKVSKTFVFFLRMSGEYTMSYGQESELDPDPKHCKQTLSYLIYLNH